MPPKTRSKNKNTHPGEDAKKALREAGQPQRRTREEVEEARRLEAEKKSAEELVRSGKISCLSDIQQRLHERDRAEQSTPAALSAVPPRIRRAATVSSGVSTQVPFTNPQPVLQSIQEAGSCEDIAQDGEFLIIGIINSI